MARWLSSHRVLLWGLVVSLMSAVVLLFLVMGPLGNVPLFLSALKNVDPSRHRKVILRDMLIALGIMLAFLFAGQVLLDILGVDSPSLTVAGGVILLVIAFRLIFPSPDRNRVEQVHEEPFVVPLAIPYTAGPSVLSTELLLMSQDPSRWHIWLLAVVIAWAAAATILLASASLQRYLGVRGLTAIERLMGMVLIILAVDMLLDGIKTFFF
jgi:multiple antibiotic resistance protein